MIFLTVGTQLPFDRLVRVVDEWASLRGRGDIIGQIAEPGSTGYEPKSIEWVPFLTPDKVRTYFDEAEFIIAHAGMGSIISAMTVRKPIIVMPRRVALREHRNDHQVATAKRIARVDGVYVADDETQMPAALDEFVGSVGTLNGPRMSFDASERFAARLRDEIFSFSTRGSLVQRA